MTRLGGTLLAAARLTAFSVNSKSNSVNLLLKPQRYLVVSHFSMAQSRSLSSYALIFKDYGDPEKVVEKVDTTEETTRQLKSDELLIEFLACPINPADINTIQGVYAVKPKLPSVGGNEGVARVIRTGDGIKDLKPDDWVIPALPGFGTWRSHAIATESQILKIDNRLDLHAAAQLSVNPCTAYRMLKDFVQLSPGDTVIQNGGNSAVGLIVIQLCKLWGVNTINVIRSRPDVDRLRDSLINMGANYVVTEEELRQRETMQKIWADNIPKPKLGLNCIGGRNASDVIRQLEDKGVLVTYGGMSKQPLTIPTSSLIFKDHRFYGYWMTRWSYQNAQTQARKDMLSELSQLLVSKKLRVQKAVDISPENFREAFENTMKGFANAKYIFNFLSTSKDSHPDE